MQRFFSAGLLAAFLGGLSAQASTIAYEDPAGQGTQAYNGNLALTFTVNAPITVLDLGAFNAAGNGVIAGIIQVAIFDMTTNTQVTPVATFQGGGYTLIDHDVFQAIAPTVLGPGLYEVDAVGFGIDPNGNLNSGSSSGPLLNDGGGLLTFTGANYDGSVTLDEPTVCAGCQPAPVPQNHQFDAGTFEFSAAGVPEPGTIGLFICGLAGLIVARRRR